MSLKSSPTKRKKIVEEIVSKINNGVLSPGTRLATVRNMSDHFDVSLSVVQNAMQELIQNNMIECRGASGFYVKSQNKTIEEKQCVPSKSNADSKVSIFCYHHSDLVWRRTFKEYEELREKQLLIILEKFKKYPEFCFFIDQTEVLKQFVNKHPEHLDAIKDAIKNGQLELSGGVSIPDLNMISGESIVRNLLYGKKYYKDNFDVDVDVSGMSDAFGMCSQLPQILNLCGYKWLFPGRMPNFPNAVANYEPFYWQGLDNTKFMVVPNTAAICHIGYEFNVVTEQSDVVSLSKSFKNLKLLPNDVLGCYLTEEPLFSEDLFWIIEANNRQGGKKIEFEKLGDYARRINSDSLPTVDGEFNPTFTGCYTTRITVKQKTRKAENLLKEAEMLTAMQNADNDFAPLWNELFLCQFHDAICGCHTDIAFEEITNKLNYIIENCEKIIESLLSKNESCIFNSNNYQDEQLICSSKAPAGIVSQQDNNKWYWTSKLPSLGFTKFTPNNSSTTNANNKGELKFKTDYFTVDFSNKLPTIHSNIDGVNVLSKENFGELLFRADYGSMWREALETDYLGYTCQDFDDVIIENGPVFTKATVTGKVKPNGAFFPNGNKGAYWPGFELLSFTYEYMFPNHLDYFKMKLTVNWQGNNTKISIRFPLNLSTKNLYPLYEVPFGAMERSPYFEVPYEYQTTLKELNNNSDYNTAKGDWPALNWVDYSDTNSGLAVANTGTPAHQLVGNNIFVSLLRSGTLRADGGMVPEVGSYDNGTREFEFAFRAHKAGEQYKAYELGQILNHPPRVSISTANNPVNELPYLSWNNKDIALSSWYNDNNDWIIRLYETMGSKKSINITSELGEIDIFEANIKGEEIAKIKNSSIKFKPFEIKTFKIRRKS